MHDVAPVLAEERLGRRAHTQALRQLFAAAHRDPRALGREALDVVLLLLQQALGDQHRHGHVLVAGRLELAVEYLLDVLPDGVAIRAHDEQALDIGIVHELRLDAHVGEPLGLSLIHISLADEVVAPGAFVRVRRLGAEAGGLGVLGDVHAGAVIIIVQGCV